MKLVLVKVSGGIIDGVTFFDTPKMAEKALVSFAKTMDPERDDAAIYDEKGLVANTKDILDENRQDTQIESTWKESTETVGKKSIYLIANPLHPLGLMVATEDPLGFTDGPAALSELGQLRKEKGNHLKLYCVIPVEGSAAKREDLEKLNAEDCVEDFDYSLVEEYLE